MNREVYFVHHDDGADERNSVGLFIVRSKKEGLFFYCEEWMIACKFPEHIKIGVFLNLSNYNEIYPARLSEICAEDLSKYVDAVYERKGGTLGEKNIIKLL